MIDPAEARRLVQWGRDNKLVFDPLPSEQLESVKKAADSERKVGLDKRIHAKQTQINLIKHKLQRGPDATLEELLKIAKEDLEELLLIRDGYAD